jgi:hypothetical protein
MSTRPPEHPDRLAEDVDVAARTPREARRGGRDGLPGVSRCSPRTSGCLELKPPATLDLTKAEQMHVRAGLQLLRRRAGGWATVAKVLHMEERTLANIAPQPEIGHSDAGVPLRPVREDVD